MANVGHHTSTYDESQAKARALNTVEGRALASHGTIAVIIGVSQGEDGNGPAGASVNRVLNPLKHDVDVVARIDGRSVDEHYGDERSTWLALEIRTLAAYDAVLDALERLSREYDPPADIAVTTGAHVRVTADEIVPTWSAPLRSDRSDEPPSPVTHVQDPDGTWFGHLNDGPTGETVSRPEEPRYEDAGTNRWGVPLVRRSTSDLDRAIEARQARRTAPLRGDGDYLRELVRRPAPSPVPGARFEARQAAAREAWEALTDDERTRRIGAAWRAGYNAGVRDETNDPTLARAGRDDEYSAWCRGYVGGATDRVRAEHRP